MSVSSNYLVSVSSKYLVSETLKKSGLESVATSLHNMVSESVSA